MASQFQPFLNSIRAAVKHENWLAALALALMLPDICATTQMPKVKGKGKRYAKWWGDRFANTYRYGTGPNDYVTGHEVWQLRCAYLHEGSELQSHKTELSAAIEKFQFASSKQQHLKPEGTIVWLDLQTFCEHMCFHVEDWEKNVLSKDTLMQTMAKKC